MLALCFLDVSSFFCSGMLVLDLKERAKFLADFRDVHTQLITFVFDGIEAIPNLCLVCPVLDVAEL